MGFIMIKKGTGLQIIFDSSIYTGTKSQDLEGRGGGDNS